MTTVDAQFQSLLNDEWEARLRHDPVFASFTGDHRFDDRLPAVKNEDFQNRRDELAGFWQRLHTIHREALQPGNQLNYDIFNRMLSDEIRELDFRGYYYQIAKVDGLHIWFPDLPLYLVFDLAADYENYLARLEAFPRLVQETIELVRNGVNEGFQPPRPTLEGVDEQLRALLVGDPAQSALYKPFMTFPEVLEENEKQRLAKEGQSVIQRAVLPGFQALLEFLNREYLPAARESIAAADLPDGRAFYEHRIRMYTTLALTPEEIHQSGLEEVNRIRSEMQAILKKVGFEGDLKTFFASLQDDPRFFAETPEALLKETAYVLKRMDGELPRIFKTLPRMSYGIRSIPDFSAPGSPSAYYMPPSGDGRRAGIYFVNTYDLPSQPLFEVESLSLHEAVPGHHLQLALQQELDQLPKFRRFTSITAYVEGWALYAERLGLELGFYDNPYSDFGRLNYEMLRACRLVVDTGMHALGWSRQQAIDHVADNSPATLLSITTEIDRYIFWPGQALAYKIGELKIRALRERAEHVLGAAFNLREFHDVILLDGSLPLDLLDEKVEKWIRQQLPAQSRDRSER